MNLKIDLDAVNNSLNSLNSQLGTVDEITKSLDVDLSKAWGGENNTVAADVASKMEEVRENIVTIRGKIETIRANVAQYSTNVSKANEAVTLNSGNNSN